MSIHAEPQSSYQQLLATQGLAVSPALLTEVWWYDVSFGATLDLHTYMYLDLASGLRAFFFRYSYVATGERT